MKIYKEIKLNSSINGINHNIIRYPDGQNDIIIDKISLFNDIKNRDNLCVAIKSRFNNWKDLELIISCTTALRRLGVKSIELDIPYLLGARSDRQFQTGGNSYLVDVIAPIINAQNYEKVHVLDVHSHVSAACIKNLQNRSNAELLKFAFTHGDLNKRGWKEVVFISPDAGSTHKIYKLMQELQWNDADIITCSKERDEKGNLSKVIVPSFDYTKDVVIVDDICDGGRTFTNIINQIKINESKYKSIYGKKYLIVTHGIFSAGFNELEKYFDGIYCTNSIKDFINNKLHQLNINDKLYQINIF